MKSKTCMTRASLMLLMMMLMATTAWADSWPEYITDIVVVGGQNTTKSLAESVYPDYTFIDQNLNDGTTSSYRIYLGYKKSSSAAYINGGYITDIIVVMPLTVINEVPSTVSHDGHTYSLR